MCPSLAFSLKRVKPRSTVRRTEVETEKLADLKNGIDIAGGSEFGQLFEFVNLTEILKSVDGFSRNDSEHSDAPRRLEIRGSFELIRDERTRPADAVTCDNTNCAPDSENLNDVCAEIDRPKCKDFWKWFADCAPHDDIENPADSKRRTDSLSAEEIDGFVIKSCASKAPECPTTEEKDAFDDSENLVD
jgi:hypothetical protein